MMHLQSLIDELAYIARRYSHDLGTARVYLHAFQDSIVIEFFVGSRKAEFDADLFSAGRGNWRRVVEHELELLARGAREVYSDFRAAPLPPGRLDNRAEKIKRAMADIGAGLHMPKPALPVPHLLLDHQRGFGAVDVRHAFQLNQHDISKPIALNFEQKKFASAEWSRRLREKVAASKRAEKHQVLCDIQDIE